MFWCKPQQTDSVLNALTQAGCPNDNNNGNNRNRVMNNVFSVRDRVINDTSGPRDWERQGACESVKDDWDRHFRRLLPVVMERSVQEDPDHPGGPAGAPGGGLLPPAGAAPGGCCASVCDLAPLPPFARAHQRASARPSHCVSASSEMMARCARAGGSPSESMRPYAAAGPSRFAPLPNASQI